MSLGCDSEVVVIEDIEDDQSDEYDNEDTPSDVPEETPEHEPCETYGESRSCEDGGTQFCHHDPMFDEYWGVCLDSYVCEPGELRDCGFDNSVTCQLDAEGIPYFPGCPFTPLVLSFDAGPIELASNAAPFDMDGAGICLNTDWPATHNPWLAIDLDHNGFVDGGHELFGSGWVLDSGRLALNGFVALATLDSNRDGKIDASDARFGELLVWRDEDGDKSSLPGELSSLTDEGVQAIELDYVVHEQCDARSNCGRERASFEFMAGGQRHAGEVVDIHLPCQ